MMPSFHGNKTGRRKLPGQSHLQVEAPRLLKQLPPSPDPELTSVPPSAPSLLFSSFFHLRYTSTPAPDRLEETGNAILSVSLGEAAVRCQ